MESYLKNKNKYKIFKKMIGSGTEPFEVLVIGGGQPELYGTGFFEVGGHGSSNFGADRDWNTLDFWNDLDKVLGEKKFKAIIFDSGSESWLIESGTANKREYVYDDTYKRVTSKPVPPKPSTFRIEFKILEEIVEILKKHLEEHGVILAPGRSIYDLDRFTELVDLFYYRDMNIFGVIRFGNNDDIYNIITFPGTTRDNICLKNTSNIHPPTIYIGELNHNNNAFIFNEHFNKVEEENQIEFIRNRIIDK